jgi:hypothetical protein
MVSIVKMLFGGLLILAAIMGLYLSTMWSLYDFGRNGFSVSNALAFIPMAALVGAWLMYAGGVLTGVIKSYDHCGHCEHCECKETSG